MANVLVRESSLQGIADAIRAKNGTQNTYKPDEMADAIEAISGGGITPTGTIEITENGVVDVTDYASADVDVPTGSNPVINSLSVTENGTYTAPSGVDGYSPVTVNVPTGGVVSGSFTPETNTNSMQIDVGTSFTHFLVHATTNPYGSGVRLSSFAYVDFDSLKTFLVSSNSSGASPSGSYAFNSILTGFTKNENIMSIVSSGSASQFNYFIGSITYQWYAW